LTAHRRPSLPARSSALLFLGDRRRKLGGLKLVVRLGAAAAVIAHLAHVPLGRLGTRE
jgi:hypothetical protein